MNNQKVLFYFRGVPVIRVTSARIRQDARKDGLYYYDIRHSDDDWGDPATVEPCVVVNHFGTMVTTKPIVFTPNEHGDQYLEIEDEEKEKIFEYCF